MRRKSSALLTPAEWNIMKIVWELGKGTSRQIHEIARERHDWASTTVKTILSTLVDKGFLKTAEDGSKYIYSPTKPPFQTLTKAADEFMDKSVDKVKGQLICYMAQKVKLSQTEIDELQTIIDQHKRQEKRAP